MEVLMMPATVLENIKGSDLPRAWLSRMKIDPQQTFTVTLEPEEVMPPEDQISEKLIKAVEASEKSLMAGKGSIHKSIDDLFKHLDKA